MEEPQEWPIWVPAIVVPWPGGTGGWPSHIFHMPSPPKLSKRLSSSHSSMIIQSHCGYIKQTHWRVEMAEGRVFGFDQPEQTSQWGWATCMGPIPMQPAASLPQTEGWVCACVRGEWGRGAAAERQRGGSEGNYWDEQKKKKRAHNRERKLGPKASKVAKGKKWRSNTVNATARVLNKASYGPAGYTVDTVCSALRITTQKN